MDHNRDTIFVSHATPEDNEFTIWLASRLELLGYKVWIDKQQLLGGEKFWQEIDQTIRFKTIKFLLVYSENICYKNDDGTLSGKLKDGIDKEYSLAESVAKEHKIDDFIIMLNIDHSSFNLFIGASRLIHISFLNNWADGLMCLENKLKKDSIPKTNEQLDSNFSEWYESKYLRVNKVYEKAELYYSSWWPINSLPEKYFILQFRSKKEADFVFNNNKDLPLGKIANNLSSFSKDIKYDFDFDGQKSEIKPIFEFEVTINNIFQSIDSSKFPNLRDSETYLKVLLSRCFHLFMKNRGMQWYEFANKRNAYFHNPKSLNGLKVKYLVSNPLTKVSKKKIKNLIGTYTRRIGSSKINLKWHFAISAKPILFPIIAYNLKSHITFTSDGYKLLTNKMREIDKDRIHTYRRSKGKSLFNEEWRDLLLAFLASLKINGEINFKISNNMFLNMPIETKCFHSKFGYIDPTSNTRFHILNNKEYEVDSKFIGEVTDDIK